MDASRKFWHYSGMNLRPQIPVFNLFGETSAFPDVVHCESIWDRARLHDWSISPHRHREMAQVFFMRQGEARVRIDGTEHPFDDGKIIFIPALVVHSFRFRQGSEGLVLSMPLTVVQGLSGNPALAQSLSAAVIGVADQRAQNLLGMIAEAFPMTGIFRANLLVSLAQALLAAIAETAERNRTPAELPPQRRMLDFDRLIAAHLGQGWGVSDYASALSITAGHLNRICRATIGQTAAQHIEAAVMTEASRLLAFTQLSVAEVGYRLGFADPSYFSRRFRANLGEAPLDYRRRFVT